MQSPVPRILLVEDYEDAREMYAESLALSGYEVVCASDGQEALDLVSGAQFDLVILDIALPRVDGLSVIRALRASDATKEIPIITVSASVGEGMHATIIATGADVALDKPCLPEELDAEVQRWLSRRSKATREPA